MADIRQTKKYSKYLERIGWQIEKSGKTLSFIKKFPIIGSIVKIQRPEEVDLKAVEFVNKKHRAFQTIVEPHTSSQAKTLKEKGFKYSRTPYLPTKTLYIDLDQSVEKIFNNLEKDARYSLRKTKNTRVYSVTDTKNFRKSWKEASGLKTWVPSTKRLNYMIESFGNDVVFLVTPGGEAGAIFLHADEKGYYWQAFTGKKGRKDLSQYKILWSGINWARNKKAKYFDFEGVYDKRFPNKHWHGFTHFKKSFGGYEVEFPGPLSKLQLPFNKS